MRLNSQTTTRIELLLVEKASPTLPFCPVEESDMDDERPSPASRSG